MDMNQFSNINLENDVLSAIICDQEALGEVLNYKEDIFYYKQNKALYSLLKAMYINDKEINLSTIIAELGTDNLKEVGGITRITELSTNYLNIGAKGFSQILTKLDYLRERRELYQLNQEIESGFNKEIPNDNIKAKISDKLDNISTSVNEDNGDIIDSIDLLAQNIEERYQNKGKVKGIETKLTGLDKRINGLNKQELIIIAGRPGQGKTTLANNIALRIAQQEKNVAIFNLEMAKTQILDKLLSCVAGVDNEKLKFGNLDDADWEKIGQGTEKLFHLSQHIKLFDSVLTLEKIIANCKKLKNKNKLDAVIIDYLQLIESDNKRPNGNREQEVSAISRKLKLLSKELQVPVIALSQLSRSCEARADKRPMLSDLRESGSIEQDKLRKTVYK